MCILGMLFRAFQNFVWFTTELASERKKCSAESGAPFILTNFNELDAYWLVERSACFQVAKPWEMTLSCHSKNVLGFFMRI